MSIYFTVLSSRQILFLNNYFPPFFHGVIEIKIVIVFLSMGLSFEKFVMRIFKNYMVTVVKLVHCMRLLQSSSQKQSQKQYLKFCLRISDVLTLFNLSNVYPFRVQRLTIITVFSINITTTISSIKVSTRCKM